MYFYRAFTGLARSCRALDSISTQYLYARYEGPLEQPVAGFLRRLAHNDDLCHGLKHINILESTGNVRQGRVSRELVASIAQLPEPYHSAWVDEARSNLALRNEIELAILLFRATNQESITMEKGTERAERPFEDLTKPPLWLRTHVHAGPPSRYRSYALPQPPQPNPGPAILQPPVPYPHLRSPSASELPPSEPPRSRLP
ncbi:hypothetical protein BU25DRAFT_420060 [Macroventuria anomochaeta]|uniref:Uncharacterized protein n=1 Tax=Macroventuria anomochaeta TaxID=301207 RepID=A0ACB6S8Z0_9PLEO|nr:uncharacterized protein BU25DRAFT_420060 [Macroventuria anomochaeta]KAF2629813.1 hypothetical protein BU25DRAFT_420060 [Macroventuria anomochaeta]